MKATQTKLISNKMISIITGGSIVLMAIVAGLIIGIVFSPLFLKTTGLYESIKALGSSFRWGIIGWLVILLCDIIVSWGVNILYKPLNSKVAMLSSWFRLIYSAILAVAIICLVLALKLVDQTPMVTSEINNQLLFLLNGFQAIWSFGLIIFGFHLLSLGVLVWNKKLLLRILGVLLIIAGLGYVLTNVCSAILPNYQDYKSSMEAVFILPMVAGELGLGIWLIVKGGR